MKPYLKDFMGDGLLIPAAAAIKQAVNIPVIAVGRLDEAKAEKILEEGKADLVAFGRVLWADPEFPRKVAEGRIEDIVRCTARAAAGSTPPWAGKAFSPSGPPKRKRRLWSSAAAPPEWRRPASPPCAGMT